MSAREELLERFSDRIRTNPDLHRALVSDKANRRARFRWILYREAFSEALARDVVERYSPRGGVVLDPFAGVGTALFAALARGCRAVGIELLPVGAFAMEARESAEQVDPGTFCRCVGDVEGADWTARAGPAHAFPHIPITRGAFSQETEAGIAAFRAHCAALPDPHVRRLFHCACLGILESVSFTRKDGQYLRWDARAPRPRTRGRFRKPRIDEFNDAITRRLRRIADDLEGGARRGSRAGVVELLRGSCLELLPAMPGDGVDLVLTSPPYCNRYDYTRTYALELAYLGLGDDDVKRLRQAMLSCTVENAAKVGDLRRHYAGLGRQADFDRAMEVFERDRAVREALVVLDEAGRRGALNNPNIPRMVENYFLEMCLVVGELARVLRPGGQVVMVNDNVRYCGEEIPVDLLLCGFAESLGLSVEHIWTLPRGKGNSSQQMGAHGRTELRKCVYLWKK